VLDADKPIYPIGVASEILEVHPRTLRIYENHGLIKPARRGTKRYFSENDIKWIRCIRALIHEDGISIEGIRRLLRLQPCWELRGCSDERRKQCSAFRNSQEPCWKLAARACAGWKATCMGCAVFKGQGAASRDKVAKGCPVSSSKESS